MTTNRFLTLVNGIITVVSSIASSSGIADASKIVSTNAAGVVDITLLPSGVGADTQSIITTEALSAGNFINIFDNAGVRSARRADASNGRIAHGFVLAGSSSGANATIYTSGYNTALTALVPGATYYLAATAGGSTTTAPVAVGQTVQNIGFALGTAILVFNPHFAITIA